MPDGQRAPERREQIVLAAAAVLGRDGYAATTLKQIAREADVAPGLLHYYFRSKDDLLIAVIEALFHRFIEEWQESVDGLSDPFDRISAAIDRFARICAERPEVTRLLLDFYALSVGTPALRDRTRRLLSELQEHVAEEIRLNTASLPTPPPAEEKDFVMAIHGALDGVSALGLVAGEDMTGAFRVLKMFFLSFAAMSFVAAGQPVPLEKIMSLIQPAGAEVRPEARP
jgi:AcrR family transcriptional regulator